MPENQPVAAGQSEELSEGASTEEAKRYDRVLVVAAHPDDPDFMAGGTVGKLASEGAEVIYVVCTDGSQGGENPAQPDEELVVMREREQRDAAGILGVKDVVFLGYRDGYLYPTVDVRRDITRQIRKYRPDLVITHAPLRQINIPPGASHPDHLATGEACMAAVYPDARNPRAYRDLLAEGLEAFKVRELWFPFFEQPNHFVDISGCFDLKLKAILAHNSQFNPDVNPRDRDLSEMEKWMRDRHHQMGEKIGVEYAEAFHRTVIEY